MASFSTYQSKLRTGLPSKEDGKWVEELLSKFENNQTALFMRWLQIKLPLKKEHKERLVVITPLRIILIKTKTFGRSVHRKYRIIDIVSVKVDDSDSQTTKCTIAHCDYPPELSISRSREKLKSKELETSNVVIDLPKDIDREFLDILQWSLFIVTRGLPNKFKPKIVIPDLFKNNISDPVGPGQFAIDRYVAYCDAQSKNSGAGIKAFESLIEYTLGSIDSKVYDVNMAFNNTTKKIDNLQFVCLSQGLSFCDVYNKLVINELSCADDTNIAILMTLFETNYAIKCLEFRRVDISSKTMRSLSSSLSCTNGLSQLQELNIIDINLNKNIVMALSTALSYIKLKVLRLTNCYLNKTATIQLFNILQKTEQYKCMTHLNISKNQCSKSGTKAIAAFLNKTTSLQVLVVADAQIDGNEFFNALRMQDNDSSLSHLDTLTLLDFSGNSIGDKGAQHLSKFISKTRCLNYLKLARCNLSTSQLKIVFNAALKNMQGFERGKFKGLKVKNEIIKRPTHAEIMLCTNLLCLSLDLSDNAFGNKGAEVICSELMQRENYTIVSLNLAKNNFNIYDMKNVINACKSLACLERLCISDNVKRGIGKKTDKDGVIGTALLNLFSQIPTLNELAICGNESLNCYLDYGLSKFLKSISTISNLEFLDFSGNKIGDKQFMEFMNALSQNSTLRLVRCSDNKLSNDMLCQYMDLLASHPSIIDKLPSISKANKSSDKANYKKMSALRDAAKMNLRSNKQQFEIDRQMMSALPREMRLEKELRRPNGTQYGICAERIRGTVQYPDYASRIPQVLVKLKNLLEARGGFETVGIFRLQPDANEFPVVKQALNTNNFEFRINDINCIANAIKVWFRDLPNKVLMTISKERVIKCNGQNEVGDIIKDIMEPYKSLFEWLLDLAVQVVENVNRNKMDERNMAVVLCPNLYENNDSMELQAALLRFTEFAIRARVDFRKDNPVQEINDRLAINAGLTPGIADQNKLKNQSMMQDDVVPIIKQMDSDYDEDDMDENGVIAAEEGDGFAGALYSGSRFRGGSQVEKEEDKVPGKLKNRMLGDFDDAKAPPPAYSSDYEVDEDQDEEQNVIPPFDHQVSSGKVKDMAAKLDIDPSAMLPGAKAPKIPKSNVSNESNSEVSVDSGLSRPAPPVSRRSVKKKKKKKKELLLESMVDNYSAASSIAKVPAEDEIAASAPSPSSPRRESHHVPMESKVLGGFVQPGLAMLAAQTEDNYHADANGDNNGSNKKRKKYKQRNDTQSSDELIPALVHLEEDKVASANMNDDQQIVDYIYEEKTFEFETKPMGFQIEAENGKISVRSVRAMSAAGKFGVKEKWDIVAVNGFRDWSSMLGILESSLGPFSIIFAVPTQISNTLEKSLSNSNYSNQHPIVPPMAKQNSYKRQNSLQKQPSTVKTISVSELPISPMKNENENDLTMDANEYKENKKKFNMMSRNSSAIAKQVLDEHEDDEIVEIKTNQNVYNASTSMQQSEFKRLEAEIKRVQNKNAQLLETLQVIRLKGEMERIELLNAKNVQAENVKLKKELNSKVKPLKAQLKNANKQIQSQRQLMYQYANLLRRNKIPIPELQASLQENESSSDSDSESSSSED